MLGSRALYHDGWKAVVFHPTPFIAYDGTRRQQALRRRRLGAVPRRRGLLGGATTSPPQEPEKLDEMKQLWWEEAGRYQVLPLNNQPGRFADRRYRRERYELPPRHRAAARGDRAEPAQPRLRDRGRRSTCRPTATVDGVDRRATAATPAATRVYLQGRRLHFAYNFLGTEITIVSASVELPGGRRGGARRRSPRPAAFARRRGALLRRRPRRRGHASRAPRRSPTG